MTIFSHFFFPLRMLQILFLKGREIATEYFLFHFQVKNVQKFATKKKIKIQETGCLEFSRTSCISLRTPGYHVPLKTTLHSGQVVYISMRTTLRTSGYHVPLTTIFILDRLYISIRTNLRTSGYHVPLETILHSQHNKRYRIEWVKKQGYLNQKE